MNQVEQVSKMSNIGYSALIAKEWNDMTMEKKKI